MVATRPASSTRSFERDIGQIQWDHVPRTCGLFCRTAVLHEAQHWLVQAGAKHGKQG